METGNRRGGRKRFCNVQRDKPKEDDPSIDQSSPIVQKFLGYRSELDSNHDKYERLIKISRDITVESKRVIFLLHRVIAESDRSDLLNEAEQKLSDIRHNLFTKIAAELINEEAYNYQRAYSPGLQEYIEAASFLYYIQHESLLSLDDLQASFVFPESEQPIEGDVPVTLTLVVPPVEYALGLADLTGELMRLAIGSIGRGDFRIPFLVCKLMRDVHDAMLLLGNQARELPRKMRTLQQSVAKVENACYTLQMRGSEIPKHMLAHALISSNMNDDGYDNDT